VRFGEKQRKDDRKTERKRDRKTSERQSTHFFPETAVGHDYGVIDVYAEVHEDGAKEMGSTIVGEKKNYEIYKVRFDEVRFGERKRDRETERQK
jgi:hypothetical protein